MDALESLLGVETSADGVVKAREECLLCRGVRGDDILAIVYGNSNVLSPLLNLL